MQNTLPNNVWIEHTQTHTHTLTHAHTHALSNCLKIKETLCKPLHWLTTFTTITFILLLAPSRTLVILGVCLQALSTWCGWCWGAFCSSFWSSGSWRNWGYEHQQPLSAWLSSLVSVFHGSCDIFHDTFPAFLLVLYLLLFFFFLTLGVSNNCERLMFLFLSWLWDSNVCKKQLVCVCVCVSVCVGVYLCGKCVCVCMWEERERE